MSTRTGTLCALLGALVLGGCTPQIEEVVVSQVTDPPLDALASSKQIDLFDGTGVGIQLQAFTERPRNPDYHCCGSNCSRQCRTFDNAIESDAVSVSGEGSVTVVPGEDEGVYMIFAEGVGTGRVVVTADDVDGDYEIPVTVRAQPESED